MAINDKVKQLSTFDRAVYTFGMLSFWSVIFRFLGHGLNGLDHYTKLALTLAALITAVRWIYKRYR